MQNERRSSTERPLWGVKEYKKVATTLLAVRERERETYRERQRERKGEQKEQFMVHWHVPHVQKDVTSVYLNVSSVPALTGTIVWKKMFPLSSRYIAQFGVQEWFKRYHFGGFSREKHASK